MDFLVFFLMHLSNLRSTDRKSFDVFTINKELDVRPPDHDPQLVPGGGQTGDGELHQGLLPHLVQAGQEQRHLL